MITYTSDTFTVTNGGTSMTISGYHTNASNQNLTLWHGDPAYSLDTYTENNVAKNTAVSHEFTITNSTIKGTVDAARHWVFVWWTSDPSTPANGTIWLRKDL